MHAREEHCMNDDGIDAKTWDKTEKQKAPEEEFPCKEVQTKNDDDEECPPSVGRRKLGDVVVLKLRQK